MEVITDYKLLLDTAVLAGQIMLQNGAEIYRVEDTIHRILKVSNFKSAEAFVTPTGLIVTLDDPKVDSMTVMKRIDTRGTNLNKITITNEISRKFCSGEMSLKEAFHELKYMDAKQYTQFQKDCCTVVVAFAFAVILGGTFFDAVGAGIAGIAMVICRWGCRKIGINYFLQLLLSSAVIAVSAFAVSKASFLDVDQGMVIIGGIMPILPGSALTIAVRDTLQGDYVAGVAKAVEAFVRAAAIAIGVWCGIVLTGGGL